MQFFAKNIPMVFVIALLSSGINADTKLPKLIIKNIINNSGQNIIFFDTVPNKAIEIAAGQSVQVNSEATTKNIVVHGSMKEVMAKEAQYIIKKADSADNTQEVYVHMNVAQGGVNDGSGIVTGRLGSIIFKFLLAGKNGGCRMSSGALENNNNSSVEVSLNLTMLKWAAANNVFALDAEYTVEEK